MFDSPTLSVSELAARWQKTPRQILDFALALKVPLYFMFDGLAFDLSDEWHRPHGGNTQRLELKALRTGIKEIESQLARRRRGISNEFDCLTSQEAQELRYSMEAMKRRCAIINSTLEQREVNRQKMHVRGLMRPAPKNLFDIAQDGEARERSIAFDFATPSRLMELEPFEALPPLTIDSLCALTAEVKAIEAGFMAKPPAPAQSPAKSDSVVAESSSVTHSTKRRRNTLTPIIELAQKKCRNPQDTAEVWAVLAVLAEQKHPPLLGATEEGLQYLKNGAAASFNREALRKRLAC